MAGEPIYLDHHATTPVDPAVLDAMLPYFREDFGNAASNSHVYGWRAEAAVEEARERVAAAIGATPREIVFTSGATESNCLAILGTCRARARGGHVVTLATEHPAVLDPCEQLTREGFEVTVVDVAPDGLVDLERLAAAIREETVLVSVMGANNEIGVLQPLDEIGALCREREVVFHSDGAQAVGKVELDVQVVPVDLLSISGHKVYGPKGIGALYVRSRRPRLKLEPILYGGGHERGLRSGTLPVPLIAGLAKALELCVAEREVEAKRLTELRERLWQHLDGALAGLRRNGHAQRRLPGNLNVAFPGVDGDPLLVGLKGVAVSSGSACSSADPRPSHVLLALGLPERLAKASLRFGLGRGTTAEQIDRAAAEVIAVARELGCSTR